MAELTPGLELPNGAKPQNYPQDFVRHARPNKPGPTNSAAKKCPSPGQVFKGVLHK